MTTATSKPQSVVQPTAGLARFWPALVAIGLALVILYGVGFAPLALHNLTHDARHAAAFPCH